MLVFYLLTVGYRVFQAYLKAYIKGLSETERELNLINPRKAIKSNIISQKLPKSAENICSEASKTIFNNFSIKTEFPN